MLKKIKAKKNKKFLRVYSKINDFFAYSMNINFAFLSQFCFNFYYKSSCCMLF